MPIYISLTVVEKFLLLRTGNGHIPSKSDGIRQLTFCSGIGSNWAKRAERDKCAAVCFSSEDYSITLRGKLDILTDAATTKDNWYAWLESHFSGADDPYYCVLRFTLQPKSISCSSIGKKQRAVCRY